MRYGNYAGEVEDNIVRYRKISRTPHERGYQVVKNCDNMLSCSDTISECDGRTDGQTDRRNSYCASVCWRNKVVGFIFMDKLYII